MDAATLAQYRPLFFVLAGAALAFGLAVLLTRGYRDSPAPAQAAYGGTQVGEAARWLMWLLAALATGMLVLLLFSVAIAFRFFQSWTVTAAVAVAVLVAALPVLAAWRTRA